MKLLFLLLSVTLAICSFRQAAVPEKNLQVFFMRSFENDSVNIFTSTSHNRHLRINAQESLEDTSQQLILAMTPLDTLITVRDVVNDKQFSARYEMNYDYLFIYYNREKFTFRFSNKLLLVQE